MTNYAARLAKLEQSLRIDAEADRCRARDIAAALFVEPGVLDLVATCLDHPGTPEAERATAELSIIIDRPPFQELAQARLRTGIAHGSMT